MPERRAVIFANGTLRDAKVVRALIRSDDLLIAADGGARHALTLGLCPAIVIGDLDSITEEDRQRVADAGAQIEQHPRDKDRTDLELALRHALEEGCDAMLIIAATGTRMDQSLASLSLLADPAIAGLDVRLEDGVEEMLLVQGQAEASESRGAQIHGRPGEVVSLIPWGAPAHGVVTQGLRWTLSGDTLWPNQTRGISNEMLAEKASVRLTSGALLCVHRRRNE